MLAGSNIVVFLLKRLRSGSPLELYFIGDPFLGVLPTGPKKILCQVLQLYVPVLSEYEI